MNDLPTLQANSQNESGFDAKSLLEEIDWKNASQIDSGKALIGKFDGKPIENGVRNGFRKALFRKDSLNNIKLIILEFVPDIMHLWRYKGINENKYDGKIYFYTSNYNLIEGFVYSEGKIIKQIIPSTNNNMKESSNVVKTQTTITVCTQETFARTNAQGHLEVGVVLTCTSYYFPPERNHYDNYTNEDMDDLFDGSDNVGTTTEDVIFEVLADEIENAIPIDDNKEPIDPEKFKNCFEDGKTAASYKLTIYIDQPVAGSNDQWSLSSGSGNKFTTSNSTTFNVGHAFVGFQKINTDGTSVTQVMGFYPGSAGQNVNGVIKDDSGHEYDVSYTATVSATKFEIALNNVVSDDILRNYVLSNASGGSQYNCTNAAINWMVNAGVNLPNSTSRGVFNTTPGDFGQDLRQLNNSNKASGTAPSGKGPCN